MEQSPRQPHRPRPGLLIESQSDLQRAWTALLAPLGFGQRSLWFVMVDADRRLTPTLVAVDELPELPSEEGCESFAAMLAHLVPADGPESVALLISRPGPSRLGVGDLAWTAGLVRACAAHAIPLWPLHVAGDDAVVAVPPDAVLGAQGQARPA